MSLFLAFIISDLSACRIKRLGCRNTQYFVNAYVAIASLPLPFQRGVWGMDSQYILSACIQSPRIESHISSDTTELKHRCLSSRSWGWGHASSLCLPGDPSSVGTAPRTSSLPGSLYQEDEEGLNFIAEFWRRLHPTNDVSWYLRAPQLTHGGSVRFFQGKHSDTCEMPNLLILLSRLVLT